MIMSLPTKLSAEGSYNCLHCKPQVSMTNTCTQHAKGKALATRDDIHGKTAHIHDRNVPPLDDQAARSFDYG